MADQKEITADRTAVVQPTIEAGGFPDRVKVAGPMALLKQQQHGD